MTTALADVIDELWLERRLSKQGVDIYAPQFAGAAPRGRKERIRAALAANTLHHVVCGNRDGKPQTYADVFRRLYGEAL